MKIGIAGVGGIGSNVAMHLVRSGVTDFVLVDFDRVDASNLNRQFYFFDQIGQYKVDALATNLRRIRPGLNLLCHICRLSAESIGPLFTGCDFVVEGFDRRQDKKMLLEQLAATTCIVSASGIAGSRLDTLCKRQLGSCTIIGDHCTDCTDAPLFSYKVGAVACLMCESVLHHPKGASDDEKA